MDETVRAVELALTNESVTTSIGSSGLELTYTYAADTPGSLTATDLTDTSALGKELIATLGSLDALPTLVSQKYQTGTNARTITINYTADTGYTVSYTHPEK